METGFVSFPSKQSGAVIYAAKAKMLSEEEENVVLVRPHSIEIYNYDSLSTELESQIEAPIKKTIIAAHKVTNANWKQDKICFISSDFLFTLLWIVDEEVNMLTTSDLRHEGIKPTQFSPIITSHNDYVFVSLYSTSLFLINITTSDKLSVKEIHFSNFIPKRMGFLQNSLYVLNAAAKNTIRITYDNLLQSTIGYNDDFVSVVSEVSDSDVFFSSDTALLAVKSGKNSLYQIDAQEKLSLIQEIQQTHPVLFSSYHNENGLFIGLETNNIMYYKDIKTNTNSEIFHDIANPSSLLILDVDNVLVTRKYLQPAILHITTSSDSEKEDILKPISSDMAYIVKHISAEHTVHGTDVLYVLHGKPSHISALALGIPYVESETVSQSVERCFVCGEALIISGTDMTQCVTGDISYFKGFITDQRTKAASKTIQVCEKTIQCSNGVSLSGINVQHACISGNIIVTSEPGSSILHIYEAKEDKIEEIKTLDVKNETSCLYLNEQNILYVATWNDTTVHAYSITSGEDIAQLLSPVSVNFVIRSIIECDNTIWIGTSRGDVYAAKFENNTFALINNCRPCQSPIILTPIENGIFVAGDKPGVCRIKDGQIDFYPSGIESCFYARQFGDFLVIIREQNYTIGALSDDAVIEIGHVKLSGSGRALEINGSSLYVITKYHNSYTLNIIDISTMLVTHSVPLPSSCVPNSVTAFSIGKDHSYFTIQYGLSGVGE